MGLGAEIEAVYKLEPIVIKTIADLKAVEQTPQVAAIVADLEAGIEAIQTARGNPAPTTSTTPAAA